MTFCGKLLVDINNWNLNVYWVLLKIRNNCSLKYEKLQNVIFPGLQDQNASSAYFNGFGLELWFREANDTDKFVSELSTLSKNKSNVHIIRELFEDFSTFMVDCTFAGRSCLGQE